jgi:murein DD-endopeptidase MepM/ murein hydrolase activator NlpD
MKHLYSKLQNNITRHKLSRAIALKTLSDFLTRARTDRIISLLLVLTVFVLMISTLNFAVAVSVEGDFVGYVSSVDELESIVSSVQETASGVLGYNYDIDAEVSYKVTVGSAESNIDKEIENKLMNSIDVIDNLALVCVNGEAVCAFKTMEEATEAVAALKAKYICDNTLTAEFADTVSVTTGLGNTALLSKAEDLKNGSLINVVCTERVTKEEALPYETEIIVDDTMYAGDIETIVSGQEGVLETVYYLTLVNGKQSYAIQADSVLLKAPVKAVIKEGSKPRNSTGTYIWPSDGYITSYYGERKVEVGSRYHCGIDVASDYGTPVWAADGGVVIFSGWESGYGNLIKIQHDNGDITYYGHNSKNLVKEGDVVAQGQQIAEMGETGIATGVHVHFEIRPEGGSPVNPMKYLPEGVLKELL